MRAVPLKIAFGEYSLVYSSSNSNRFIGNRFRRTIIGVNTSSDTIFQRNQFTGSELNIHNADENVVDDNTFAGGAEYPISITGLSRLNTVTRNDSRGNVRGIHISRTADLNEIFNNTFTENYRGVRLVTSGTDNHIYHNNIFANTDRQVSVDPAIVPSYELSYNNEGNWWGRTNPPCFVPGVDSNRTDVKDSFPYCQRDSWKYGIPPVPLEAPPVPLYMQVVSPFPSEIETARWASRNYAYATAEKPYKTCGWTIGGCGCAITSMVMLGRYYDINAAIDHSGVDPGNINAWLVAHDGYTSNGKLWWNKSIEYLGYRDQITGKTMVRFDFNERTDWNVPFGSSRINDFLGAGRPLVVYKNAFSHYLVVDGKLFDGRYRIKDPRWYNTQTSNDAEDLSREIRGYGNSFDTANLFTHLEVPKPLTASMYIAIASPAELLVTDPQGRKLGKDSITNTVYDEIPDGIYTKEGPIASSAAPLDPAAIHESKVIAIPAPLDGSYNIRVIGTASGSYTLDSLVYDQNGQSEASVVEGNTATGNIQNFGMDYSPQSVEETKFFRTISIDIKPGSDPNSINLKSKGITPVAVLTDEFFDAKNVLIDSVIFAGASSQKGKPEDIDKDGDLDLMLHFDTQSLQLTSESAEAVLTGQLADGTLIRGADSVRLVRETVEQTILVKLFASMGQFIRGLASVIGLTATGQ